MCACVCEQGEHRPVKLISSLFAFTGHWSIIQVLSRKGIYVAEAGDAVVTETVLMQTAPFKVVSVCFCFVLDC